MTTATGFRYPRLLLKLSGEALVGKAGYGIDVDVVMRLCRDMKEAVEAGAEIAVVVGGGNIFRGLAGAAKGMDRATAQYSRPASFAISSRRGSSSHFPFRKSRIWACSDSPPTAARRNSAVAASGE
jgi:hypothetical protein